MMQNKKAKRITAWVVMVATVLVILFSTYYLVEHSYHNCTGNECPICMVMEQCSNNLKTMSTDFVFACTSLFILTSLLKEVHYELNIFNNSLISQKVRMNN